MPEKIDNLFAVNGIVYEWVGALEFITFVNKMEISSWKPGLKEFRKSWRPSSGMPGILIEIQNIIPALFKRQYNSYFILYFFAAKMAKRRGKSRAALVLSKSKLFDSLWLGYVCTSSIYTMSFSSDVLMKYGIRRAKSLDFVSEFSIWTFRVIRLKRRTISVFLFWASWNHTLSLYPLRYSIFSCVTTPHRSDANHHELPWKKNVKKSDFDSFFASLSCVMAAHSLGGIYEPAIAQ